MPFVTVRDLMASDLFAKDKEMQRWPAFRLARFVEVFQRIYALVLQRGGSEKEAEANAIALAHASARRFIPTPSTAKVEAAVHYFTPLQPHQYSGGAEAEDLSFDYILANLSSISAAVAGNAANLEHEHTEPTAVIHGLLRPEDVPEPQRTSIPPGTPFVVSASYYEDTPERIRATRTISGEWLQSKRADGRGEVVFFETFAITEDPATDEVLGVGRIAKAAQNTHKGNSALSGTRSTMADEQPNWQEKAAGLERQLAEVTAKLAYATGTKDPSGAQALDLVKKAEERIAAAEKFAKAAQQEAADAKKVAEELKQASLQQEAEAWADKMFAEKEMPADAKGKWASAYLRSKDEAVSLMETVPARILKPGPGKAIIAAKSASAEEQKAFREQMESVFSGKAGA